MMTTLPGITSASDLLNDPWLDLRNAIIIQAAMDFDQGFRDPEKTIITHNVNHGPFKEHRDDAIEFFKGRWCAALLSMDNSDVTGEGILRQLKEYTLEDIKHPKGRIRAI